jgi:hypothetical protein
MDGTWGWQIPSGPPPTGGWIPLVDYFGWPSSGPSNFFGWRLLDGPSSYPAISRVKHMFYIDQAPNVRAGMGYGTSVYAQTAWAEYDEIAVVIY